jgi:hypothetical protein
VPFSDDSGIDFWLEGGTPLFFVSAESKDVTDGMSVSADSAGVKVAMFSISWEGMVSADSKGVMGAICL